MTPELGALFVAKTTGWRGAVIRLVEGDIWHWRQALVNHCGAAVGPQTFTYRGRTYFREEAVVEGRPGGAGLAPASLYADAIWSTATLPLDPDNGRCNAEVAMGMIGTRYGWLNCLCIGLVKVFGWHVPPIVLRILKSRRWAECAQLGDFIWTDGAELCLKRYGKPGRHLFNDGRPAGLVSPEDVLEVFEAARTEPVPSTGTTTV